MTSEKALSGGEIEPIKVVGLVAYSASAGLVVGLGFCAGIEGRNPWFQIICGVILAVVVTIRVREMLKRLRSASD